MTDTRSCDLRVAGVDEAALMHGIITAAFSARRPLDPPADALGDTVEAIRARFDGQVGIIASLDGVDVGCLFVSFDIDSRAAMIHRVSVLPQAREHGVATDMATAAGQLAVEAGMRTLQLVARRELPEVVAWWQDHGFTVADELDSHRLLLCLDLPVRIMVPTSADMATLGRRLARVLRGGDVIVASGELGAGKTTLAQGLGDGMAVQGPITSPTFVLSRIHPSQVGPQLVHVDAYRLGSAAEVDDLDLDDSVPDSVTFIEWGAGLVEQLAADRLEIDIDRSGEVDDDTRIVTVRTVGPRWAGVDLHHLLSEEQ